MKDVEFTALLLLLIEEGAKGYSQDGLDQAFTVRDASWEKRVEIEDAFRATTLFIKSMIESSDQAKELLGTRLRNQADFYSLFGAISALVSEASLVPISEAASRLSVFVADVEDEGKRADDVELLAYYDAARSASNDKGPREIRLAFMKKLLTA